MGLRAITIWTDRSQLPAPLVTVYQEPRLAVVTEKTNNTKLPQNVQKAHRVMSEAIGTGQSVRFRKVLPDTRKSSMRHAYFTPKRLFFENGRFFTVGVHHFQKRVETVDMYEITEIELVQYRQPKMGEAVEQVWSVYEARQ